MPRKKQVPQKFTVTYREEYVKCGKPNCSKCTQGKGHGPYHYAYWREGSKIRKRYIGKKFKALRELPGFQNLTSEQLAPEGQDKIRLHIRNTLLKWQRLVINSGLFYNREYNWQNIERTLTEMTNSGELVVVYEKVDEYSGIYNHFVKLAV